MQNSTGRVQYKCLLKESCSLIVSAEKVKHTARELIRRRRNRIEFQGNPALREGFFQAARLQQEVPIMMMHRCAARAEFQSPPVLAVCLGPIPLIAVRPREVEVSLSQGIVQFESP